LNFETECQRLCDGFVASLQKLGIGQTISDMFGMAKPDWEKSPGLVVSRMSQYYVVRVICKIRQNIVIIELHICLCAHSYYMCMYGALDLVYSTESKIDGEGLIKHGVYKECSWCYRMVVVKCLNSQNST